MIKYDRINDNEYEIIFNGNIAGVLRFYEDIDFTCCGIALSRFLGYISINKEYRQRGILKDVIGKFNVKSLMVDDIEDVSVETLIRIYGRLGFRLIDGSKQFMIR